MELPAESDPEPKFERSPPIPADVVNPILYFPGATPAVLLTSFEAKTLDTDISLTSPPVLAVEIVNAPESELVETVKCRIAHSENWMKLLVTLKLMDESPAIAQEPPIEITSLAPNPTVSAKEDNEHEAPQPVILDTAGVDPGTQIGGSASKITWSLVTKFPIGEVRSVKDISDGVCPGAMIPDKNKMEDIAKAFTPYEHVHPDCATSCA
jgi:hypothetical protein